MQLGRKLLIPVRDRLGPRGRRYAETLRVALALMKTGGTLFERNCNICGYQGRFYPAGFPPGQQLRIDAGCPSCGSLERHRFLKSWVDRNKPELDGKRALHFAPEQAVARFIAPLSKSYATADFDPDKKTDLTLNIEDIDVADDEYDLIICSHVLEHVDDRKALPELRRILTPGGVLLVMVPVIDAWAETFEDGAIDTPEKRLLYYGHSDHVRMYGGDVAARIIAAGFEVETVTAKEPEASLYGMRPGDRLFICRKPAQAASTQVRHAG